MSTNSTTPTLLASSDDLQKPWFFLSTVKIKVNGVRYTSTRRDSNAQSIVSITQALDVGIYDVEVSVTDHAGNTRITIFTDGLKID